MMLKIFHEVTQQNSSNSYVKSIAVLMGTDLGSPIKLANLLKQFQPTL